MKRIAVIFLFLLIQCSVVNSQSQYWLGFGFNMSRFNMKNGLNYVIDRYNDTRPFLSDEMHHVHYADGLAFSMGTNVDRFMIDFGYNGKIKTVSAKGNYGAGNMQRDIRFKNKVYSIGMGYAFANTRNASIVFGCSFDFGRLKIDTRVDETNKIEDAKYSSIINDLSVGNTFFMQFFVGAGRHGGVALIIRPYYSINYLKYDFSTVNEAINPATYLNDPYTLEGGISNFGLSIILALYGSSD
jgi:hypothetical protein